MAMSTRTYAIQPIMFGLCSHGAGSLGAIKQTKCDSLSC